MFSEDFFEVPMFFNSGEEDNGIYRSETTCDGDNYGFGSLDTDDTFVRCSPFVFPPPSANSEELLSANNGSITMPVVDEEQQYAAMFFKGATTNDSSGRKREFPNPKMINSFFPTHPPEEVQFYLRICRGGNKFARNQEVPKEISAYPYKYNVKIITTLPSIRISTSNRNILFTQQNFTRCRYSNIHFEYRVQFFLDNRVKRNEERVFSFQVFSDKGDLVNQTGVITLRSKRTTVEKKFWEGVNGKKSEWI